MANLTATPFLKEMDFSLFPLKIMSYYYTKKIILVMKKGLFLSFILILILKPFIGRYKIIIRLIRRK